MTLSRRQFVYGSTAATLGATLPFRHADASAASTAAPLDIRAAQKMQDQHALVIDAMDVRALALRAVDTAKSAGATYADVRLTRTVVQQFTHREAYVTSAIVGDSEEFAVGVRALFNGYWGFAASPYWTIEEMARLAREAVLQARQNALGSARQVDLGTIPVATGTWTTPGIDPFTITIEEKIDFMNGWRQAINDAPKSGFYARPSDSNLWFARQERAMASTEGTYVMQTTYRSRGTFAMGVGLSDWRSQEEGRATGASARGLGLQGRGWEMFPDAKIKEQIPGLMEGAVEQLKAPHRLVDIGRYDVVFDASVTAALLDSTIGVAAQVDRALGLEANGSGTSYLGPDPLEMLGTFAVGAPQLTVTGNRSLPGGAATVKWDDEGVEPADFTLVSDGVLADYQTNREQAAWLAPWYQKRTMPVKSHGCAAAPSAMNVPIQHTPNLVMKPGATAASFSDLVSGVTKGIAFIAGSVSTDFQAKNGNGGGLAREITNGKLGAVLYQAGYLFRTTELWKNITALGGPESARVGSATHYKGQPYQAMPHSVSAVPMTVKNMNIINVSRRA